MSKYKNIYRIESARLQGWDYSEPWLYFVTINTKDHSPIFGQIINSKMELNKVGEIAESCWNDIPIHFPNVELDDFIIMPSHVHGIILIKNCKDVARNVSPADTVTTEKDEWQNDMSKISPQKGSLSIIIRSFKSAVAKAVHINGCAGFLWQPRYYDRVIRDEIELFNVRNYIEQNPVKWDFEKDE